MASLQNVTLKLDWAYECLKRLNTELQRHFSEEVSDVVAEVHPGTDFLRCLIVESAQVPPSVPLLIGDCLQNLRSCLDYLVWELVLAAKNVPDQKNQFPICRTERRLKTQLEMGRLDGVAKDARAQIEALQPCRCADERGRALLVLDELCNINKHRHLLVTKAEPVGVWMDFPSDSGDVTESFIPVGEQATDIRIGSAMREGEEAKGEGISVTAVVFDEGTVRGFEVCQYLGQLGLIVSKWVIPRFERFFERSGGAG